MSKRRIHNSFQELPLYRSRHYEVIPLGFFEILLSGGGGSVVTSLSFSEVSTKILWPHPGFSMNLDAISYFENLADWRHEKCEMVLFSNWLSYIP